jgi:hypothetical protein
MSRSLAAAFAAFVLSLASQAFAGPYLDTAHMLLRESLQAGDWVRANVGERDLAKAARRVAEARLDAANHMTVPKEVDKAHPHLLLSLANMERAFEAASRGEVGTFLRLLDASRGEARTYRAVLEQLGHKLPQTRDGPR